jgi:hypothetical protein
MQNNTRKPELVKFGLWSAWVEGDAVIERSGQAFDGYRIHIFDPNGEPCDPVEHDHSRDWRDVASEEIEELAGK